MNIEIMRNTLYKAYLEDFYKFCQVNNNQISIEWYVSLKILHMLIAFFV